MGCYARRCEPARGCGHAVWVRPRARTRGAAAGTGTQGGHAQWFQASERAREPPGRTRRATEGLAQGRVDDVHAAAHAAGLVGAAAGGAQEAGGVALVHKQIGTREPGGWGFEKRGVLGERELHMYLCLELSSKADSTWGRVFEKRLVCDNHIIQSRAPTCPPPRRSCPVALCPRPC